jgi:hypothetical protein
MTCDINGRGCKGCPGIWIAGVLLVVMFLQSWLFPVATSTKTTPENFASQSQQAEDFANPQ